MFFKFSDSGRKNITAWLLFFFYSFFTSVIIQWVLLPRVFPSWHFGDGLLKAGDWIGFHEAAVQLAATIKLKGWSAWELYPPPERWFEAGLLGALYVFLPAKPWVLLPLNAMVHATSGVLIIQILLPFAKEHFRKAFFATLPFVIFPSSLIWVAQIHKDGVAILGCLFFLFGWLKIYRTRDHLDLKNCFTALLYLLLGGWLTWLTRTYLNQVFWGFSWVFLTLTLVSIFKESKLKNTSKTQFSRSAFMLIAVVMVQKPLLFSKNYSIGGPVPRQSRIVRVVTKPKPPLITAAVKPVAPTVPVTKRPDKRVPSTPVTAAIQAPHTPEKLVSSTPVTAAIQAPETIEEQYEEIIELEPYNHANPWTNSKWIPDLFEQRLYTIATIRLGYTDQVGVKSNIDSHILFNNIWEMIVYVPRALSIMLWAPFPQNWFSQSSTEANSAFKKLVALEISLWYLCFPFFLIALYQGRRNPEVWIMLLFSIGIMLLYALAIPNLGALHRFRYVFLTMLMGLGLMHLPKLGLGIYRKWSLPKLFEPKQSY